MISFVTGFLNCLSAYFRSRSSPALEILVLRQQLGVLKRRQPRPRLKIQDRMFWVLPRRLWPAWKRVLVIVKRISPGCPWQNGVAERWIESCRRELLDQVIVFNAGHFRRLIRDYGSDYHTDRIHDSLEKDTPAGRAVSLKPSRSAAVVSFPRLGGLDHRYDWQQAA
jgi:hypothetical protein